MDGEEHICQRPNKRRKNLLILDADYDPKLVNATTRWRWQKKLMKLKNNIVTCSDSPSTCTTSETADQENVNCSNHSTDDLNLNMNSSVSSPDNSLLDFEMPLEEDNVIEGIASASSNVIETQKMFSSCSSSDSGDHVWYDIEDCEDYRENEQSNAKNKMDFSDSYKKMGHVTMFPESQLSTRDVSLMVMAYSIRFHCTYEAREALFEMCKVFAGDRFQSWNTSKYILNQLYDPPDKVITLHFLCNECYKLLIPPISKKNFRRCNVKCSCGLDYCLTTESSNYVIGIDLKYQLDILLEDKEIKMALLGNIQAIKERQNEMSNISDIYDGLLYKKLQRQYYDSEILTLNFSTDGAPLCNSAKKSFWPMQVTVQELPPKLRFKNPLLCGLSINKTEPSPQFMNSYMKLFVQQMCDLAENGIDVKNEDGKFINLKVLPLCCPVDSVARPILQNRLPYNAYSGCSWCYEKGDWSGNAMRYLVKEKEAELRSDESHRKDCTDQEKYKKPTIRGVKGHSTLLTLLCFDVVWGFPIDYLHAILLGVEKYLWDIWIETKIITKDALVTVNKRLLQMTPPQEIHRQPRPITEKAKWKGSEWRSWLLFYSFVCLKGILPTEVLNHYALLVESIFILLQDSISEEELIKCEEKLFIFVATCQEMFGNSVMTFNMHSLLHLVQSVRMTGPLWCTSTFPFEGAIFYLKRAMSGPKGVYDQIAKRTLIKATFGFTVKKLATSKQCSNFCENIFSHSENKSAIRTNDNVVLLDASEENANGEKLFKRCIYISSIFHSIKYVRPTKTNDTFVALTSEEIGEILDFKYIDGKTFVVLNMYKIIPNETIPISHLKQIQPTTSVQTVLLENIREKLIYMRVEECLYIARLPNKVEIQ